MHRLFSILGFAAVIALMVATSVQVSADGGPIRPKLDVVQHPDVAELVERYQKRGLEIRRGQCNEEAILRYDPSVRGRPITKEDILKCCIQNCAERIDPKFGNPKHPGTVNPKERMYADDLTRYRPCVDACTGTGAGRVY